MSAKKIFILGFIVILLIAIPLTIYLLQQQQETRSRATKATVVSFTPSTKTVNAGETFTLDIEVDPGSNIVTLVQLYITYDPTKLATASADGIGIGLVPNNLTVPVILQSPKYTQNSISVSLSPGANVNNFIQSKTKVATLVMRALAPTDTTPAQIAFGTEVNQTDIRSTGSSDQPSENVLSTTVNAEITIKPSQSTSTSTGSNTPPVCTALNVDRTASGPAPFAITFTAIGNDTDGTISKATFNFGDGPVQDVSQGTGIGTNSVSIQISHSYNNPGPFTATAVLTDNQGGVSTTTNCTQTITVTQAVVAPTATPSASLTSQTILVTATPVPTSEPVVLNPSIIPPGPSETMLKIGGAGLILSILGGLIFLAL